MDLLSQMAWHGLLTFLTVALHPRTQLGDLKGLVRDPDPQVARLAADELEGVQRKVAWR